MGQPGEAEVLCCAAKALSSTPLLLLGGEGACTVLYTAWSRATRVHKGETEYDSSITELCPRSVGWA